MPGTVSALNGHGHPREVVCVLIHSRALILAGQKDWHTLRVQADVSVSGGGPTASAQMIISVIGIGAL